MTFKLLGVNFYVSVPFAIILAFMLVCDKTGLMSASLFAVAFHEFGHLIAMRVLKCEPRTVKLSSAGILICGTKYCSIKENVIISFSGPFVNFIFTLLFWVFGRYSNSFLLLSFSAVQFIVGLVNVLPVKGLDGGTLLYLFLQKINLRYAGLIFSFISVFFACVVLVFGVAIAVKNVGNPSLLLLGIYLIVLNVMKR